VAVLLQSLAAEVLLQVLTQVAVAVVPLLLPSVVTRKEEVLAVQVL
jgi:hypothetical protein